MNSADARQAVRMPFKMSPEQFERLFAGAAPERFDDGHTLFIQDDPATRIFGLVSGAVEISIYAPDGRKVVANIETPGNLIGEIGALDGGRRTATATCIGDCEVQSISSSVLIERVTRDPVLSWAMIALLCGRIRWISNEFGDQALMRMDARLAKRLLMLSSVLGNDGGWIEIPQTELAEFLGTTRETVNKALRRWREAGVIAIGRGRIRVLEPGELAKVIHLETR